MQIDDPLVGAAIVGVLGAGWKWLQSWMKRVDSKLDFIAGQPEKCGDKYVTKEECDKCYKGVWKAVNKLDDRLHDLETGKK